MPTAEEFRAAVREFDSIAGLVPDAIGAVRSLWGPHVATGSWTATVIAEQVSTAEGRAKRIAEAAYGLADECRRRAVVCDQYSAQVRVHQAQVRRFQSGGPGADSLPTPNYPTKPATWVDAS